MVNLRRTRAKRLILDIGASAIRLCELTQTKSGYQLSRYYQREVLVDPLLDEQAKKKLRGDALKALLKEAKIRTKKTVFGVPGRSVFTRTRTLPPVPEYKVTQIVRYEIQQQIPFALDQIALDYQILSRTDAGGYDVMMAAIKVDVVEKNLEILREAKRSIRLVDVSPLAAYNWLKHTGEFGTQGECVALLDLGASSTDIVIERGNQFRFTRPLNLAGDDITSALRDAFGLNFADAEKLKRERGFAPTGDPQRDGKLGEVIGQVLSRLVTEINRSFAYFRSLPGGGTIDRIIVTGGGACLRNIVPYFQRQFGVEVRIARPTAGLAIAPAAQEVNEHPEQTSVVLGLALRTLQTVPIEINLIPPGVLEAARRREQVLYWVLSFVTLALIAASIIPARATKDRMVRERIDILKQYVSYYDPALAEDPNVRSAYEDELDSAKRSVKFRQGQLQTLGRATSDSDCRFWLDDLKLLNTLRPEGGKVWFSSVETTLISPGRPDPRRPTMILVNSSGMCPLTPTFRTGDRGRGEVYGGGLGGDRGLAASFRGGLGVDRGLAAPPGGGPAASQELPALPIPNGYRIYGYAKDADTLMLFIKQLKDHPRFQYGVYWNEADFEKVYVIELDNARIPQRGGGSAQSIGPGRSIDTGASYAQAWDTVVFFRLDVQFGPSVEGPAVGVGAPAGAFGPTAPPQRGPRSRRDERGMFGSRGRE